MAGSSGCSTSTPPPTTTPTRNRSPSTPLGGFPRSSSLDTGVNYMRNSVKAVIDAYDGDVTFYLNDPDDPLAQAWNQVYPGLLRPASEMPEGLVDHLRYPQDMFRIQGQLYLEYHVTDFSDLFSGNDAWSLPTDPSTISRGQSVGSELLAGDMTPAQGTVDYRDEILPYYLLTTIPGGDRPLLSAAPTVHAPGQEEHGQLPGRRLHPGALRATNRLQDAPGGTGRWDGAGGPAHRAGPDHLPAVHPVEQPGLKGDQEATCWWCRSRTR